MLWLWLVHTHAMEPNELEWLYFIQIVCVGAIFSILCVTFESIDVAFCLKYIFSFVHNGFLYRFYFSWLVCNVCLAYSRQTFPIAWKILWNLFRFTFYSLSLLFFSFSTRQRVFFSRYNNTTMGFDGFALLLVYVCGSLVVSFPTFKQHQLKIFFSTVGIYISSKAFCIKTLH